MTSADLASKINFIRKRHNIRQIVVVIIAFAIFIGGAMALDLIEITKLGRQLYLLALAIIVISVGAFGTLKNLKADEKDCYNNSVVCPHCGKYLYKRWTSYRFGDSPELTGKCGHCNTNLID